jgi:hypothetical protein
MEGVVIKTSLIHRILSGQVIYNSRSHAQWPQETDDEGRWRFFFRGNIGLILFLIQINHSDSNYPKKKEQNSHPVPELSRWCHLGP